MAKPRRKMWTDQEKEDMLLATENMSTDSVRSYLQANHIKMQLNSLRTLRTRYIKANPEFEARLQEAPLVPDLSLAPAPAHARNGDFRSADEAKQRLLLMEYNALNHLEKKAWRETYQMQPWDISGYRKKLDIPKNVTAEKPSTALVRVSNRQARQGPIDIPVIPLQQMPARPEVSLGDAINAMQVKLDHYSEFLADLRRIQNTGR